MTTSPLYLLTILETLIKSSWWQSYTVRWSICVGIGWRGHRRISTFNNLTSNYDNIQVEKKYKDPFKFVNFAKLVWATNSLAKVFEVNNGFYRRVELILFINEFKACDYDQARLDAIHNSAQLSDCSINALSCCQSY